jgi:L-ascorbate metabolism protein UlaG (beta-lactamase superfamily)
MRLVKYRHSCLLAEEGSARVLLDPGGFSQGFEGLSGLTAVLFTHQHADHFDLEKLHPLLRANPDAEVVADEGTAAKLEQAGVESRVVGDGDVFELAGVEVRVAGSQHAVVHPELPVIPNVGYLIGGRFFHPGDALTVPDQPVEILGVPTGAPWLKASEAVEYMRAVKPRTAVPIHEAILAKTGIYYGLLERFAEKDSIELRNLDDGRPVEL